MVGGEGRLNILETENFFYSHTLQIVPHFPILGELPKIFRINDQMPFFHICCIGGGGSSFALRIHLWLYHKFILFFHVETQSNLIREESNTPLMFLSDSNI